MQTILEAFRGHVGNLSVNGYGCRVIQRLLEKVPEPQRRFIFQELHAEGKKLITDSYGNYVVQHVIEHGLPEDRAKIVTLIKASYLEFSKHKFASNVVERCLTCGDDEQRKGLVDAFVSTDQHGENSLLNLLRDGYGNYVIQKLLETLSKPDYLRFVDALRPELDKCKKIVTGGKQIVSVSRLGIQTVAHCLPRHRSKRRCADSSAPILLLPRQSRSTHRQHQHYRALRSHHKAAPFPAQIRLLLTIPCIQRHLSLPRIPPLCLATSISTKSSWGLHLVESFLRASVRTWTIRSTATAYICFNVSPFLSIVHTS